MCSASKHVVTRGDVFSTTGIDEAMFSGQSLLANSFEVVFILTQVGRWERLKAGKEMANYPQKLAQDAVCQSHTGHMTGLWFLPTRPLRLNTNE